MILDKMNLYFIVEPYKYSIKKINPPNGGLLNLVANSKVAFTVDRH